MRRFAAEYLRETRRGMWTDRSALAGLDLPNRRRVLDVGCGTGELTTVLSAETPGEVVGLDRDPALLAHLSGPAVLGDALSIPFTDDSFDLVVCQALLINLPDPAVAVREFGRVSGDLVAAIEPDNGAVTIDSTVAAESQLAETARKHYVAGVNTDVTLGADAAALFRDAGFTDVSTVRYDHTRTVTVPYAAHELEAAKRKALGSGLEKDRKTLLAGDLTADQYDALRTAWREMGREAIAQMQAETYEKTETVPFYVTVGRV
ncbi:class I SAM-dependent methyltransferase [Haladaptatus sp. GCM10025707]|uniref:class I SAM-dependent methyltransferase n=1 Tax=unclassified Haladaptatus TaxID=2622732 RepID=UPI0023E7C5BF|nr:MULTISPECIES: class I SAM-dependent methyltransferase [unclassified Haladaptatus]